MYCNYVWYICTQKIGREQICMRIWYPDVWSSNKIKRVIENNLQKTPSEKSGVVVSSADLRTSRSDEQNHSLSQESR